MIYDMEMQKTFYASYAEKVEKARKKLGRAMTLAEKILYAHLYDENTVAAFRRGKSMLTSVRPRSHAGCDGPDGAVAVYECGKIRFSCSCYRTL